MKIKKWEIVLAIFTVAFAFVIFNITGEQKEISSKLIRMHVIANSDSAEDQELKLLVRDAVNDCVGEIIDDVSDKNDAQDVISDNVHIIEDAAQATVAMYGYDYDVDVAISEEQYPTREYENFSLPAGKYTSLQIKIGDASGKNWWCVVFPPLCTASAEPSDLTEMHFTEEEVRFITSDESSVVFKFKLLEIINNIKSII